MNYTKYLHSFNQGNNRFQFKVSSPLIRDSMITYSDIQRAQYIIGNYARIELQIDINEYFAYFLKEKNEFIIKFYQSISLAKKTLAPNQYSLYLAIFSILKNSLDELLTEFKLLKQRLFRKVRNQERFNEIKISYFKSLNGQQNQQKSSDSITNDNKSNNIRDNVINAKSINPQFIEDITKEESDLSNYKESKGVMNIFMNNETKNYEKTKQILFELSDVMNIVQKKMYEQGEMTKQSKSQ